MPYCANRIMVIRLVISKGVMDMDARINRSNETYKLVNRETGSVEADGLGRVAARDKQNVLWASGVKTTLVEE